LIINGREPWRANFYKCFVTSPDNFPQKSKFSLKLAPVLSSSQPASASLTCESHHNIPDSHPDRLKNNFAQLRTAMKGIPENEFNRGRNENA
jgi:hypothetical protein